VSDLSRICASYGLKTAIIVDQTNLREEFRRVLAMEGPVICDVHVIPNEIRASQLSAHQKADGSFVSKPFEDLFPFLPREEFLANMIVKPLQE
jgi:acetolactate synthase-1/2/3 large subunit